MGATTENVQFSSPTVGTAVHRSRRVVDDEALQAAVASTRSWRGVLRVLGLPPSSAATSRRLRRRADELGLSYVHFGYQHPRWERAELVDAVASART